LFNFKNREDKTIPICVNPSTIKETNDNSDDPNTGLLGDLAAKYLADAKVVGEETAEKISVQINDDTELGIDNDDNIDAAMGMHDDYD
jgi:hypothetical protein